MSGGTPSQQTVSLKENKIGELVVATIFTQGLISKSVSFKQPAVAECRNDASFATEDENTAVMRGNLHDFISHHNRRRISSSITGRITNEHPHSLRGIYPLSIRISTRAGALGAPVSVSRLPSPFTRFVEAAVLNGARSKEFIFPLSPFLLPSGVLCSWAFYITMHLKPST